MSDELNVLCVTVPYTVMLTKANITSRWWLEWLGTLSSLAQCETDGPSEVMAPCSGWYLEYVSFAHNWTCRLGTTSITEGVSTTQLFFGRVCDSYSAFWCS